MVSLIALSGFFFLEFLELVLDPVSAFHLLWQFLIASVLLSSCSRQMVLEVGCRRIHLPAPGTADAGDEGVGPSPWEDLWGQKTTRIDFNCLERAPWC